MPLSGHYIDHIVHILPRPSAEGYNVYNGGLPITGDFPSTTTPIQRTAVVDGFVGAGPCVRFGEALWYTVVDTAEESAVSAAAINPNSCP